MKSATQLRARAQLCYERARTARNRMSRANFLAFAEEYERQAEEASRRARADVTPNGLVRRKMASA